MEAAIKARRRKPIFAVDIAVPRDIEAEISKLNDVYLYTIDDLNKVVLEGQGSREEAAQDANRILDEEIARYLNMERAKQVAPLITALRENANSVRADILKQAQKRLAKGADGQEVLEYATAALMKKMLHNPSVKLREAGENSETEIIAAARALFGLDEE
jgi:glutamyl-tRNA reductase